MKPLDNMTFKELRQYARDIGASSITRLTRRDELIRALKRLGGHDLSERKAQRMNANTNDTNKVTYWRVAWRWTTDREDDIKVGRVILTEGYTTKDDIPRIIAVRTKGNPELSKFVEIIACQPIGQKGETSHEYI